ncbi:glycosyltransferase family protein [Nocardia stercoris]|uniref:hypothetical protein n=1 Tax=Nocardia stercoris TaxID=2483361 RepID=UPI000EFACA9B|nr:hypothetical protein [Nocardia stercoris]
MRRFGVALESITTCLATMVAGLTVMLPVNYDWSPGSSVMQVNLLSSSLPKAIATGAVTAVIVAVVTAVMPRLISAWVAALAGIGLLYIDHSITAHTTVTSTMATVNFLDAVGGGVLLGAVAVAAVRDRPQILGWSLGAAGAIIVGSTLPVAHNAVVLGANELEFWRHGNLPPILWLRVVLVLVLICAVIDRRRVTGDTQAPDLPIRPLLAGVVVVTAALVGSLWLAPRGDDVADMVLVVGATLVASWVAALLMPDRDGALLLMTTALAAVSAGLVPQQVGRPLAALLMAMVAVGVLAGFFRPLPFTAFAGMILAAVYGIAYCADNVTGVLHPSVVAAAIALIGGLCFGSFRPQNPSSWVVGTVVIFAPTAIMALRNELLMPDFGTVTVTNGRWMLYPMPPMRSATPHVAGLVLTIGCMLGLAVLYRLRPESAPAATEPPAPDAGSPADSGDTHDGSAMADTIDPLAETGESDT